MHSYSPTDRQGEIRGPKGQAGPKRGWHEGEVAQPTKTYQLEKQFTKTPHEITQEELEHEFAIEFAREFIKDNIITIEKAHDLYDYSGYKFRAAMTVSKAGMSHVAKKYDVFHAFDQRWSEDEVRKALEYTYPERFL